MNKAMALVNFFNGMILNIIQIVSNYRHTDALTQGISYAQNNGHLAQIYLGNSRDTQYQNGVPYTPVAAVYLGSVPDEDSELLPNHFWLCRDHQGRVVVAETCGHMDVSTSIRLLENIDINEATRNVAEQLV